MARTDESLRRAALLVWSAELAMLALDVVATIPHNDDGLGVILSGLLFVLIAFSFSTVGLLVLRRSPRHRMGWFLVLFTGSGIAVPALLDAYALQGLVNAPGSLPGAAAAAASNQGSWVLAIGTIGIFLVLLFPDGRLPSPRWRWLAWVGGLDIVAIAVLISLLPGKIEEGTGQGLVNPIGLESAEDQLMVAFIAAIAVLPLCIVAAAVAMVLRFRRSQGTERLQLKWFASAAAFVAAFYLVAMIAQFAKPSPFDGPDPGWLLVLQQLTSLSFAALPLAIGASILRHRLYDIDVVIKRTLVYGSLTLTLALVYLGLVLTLRAVPGEVVGDSDLAVAASTLAVAGLFRPLRRRIQTAVDHRFFRRAYDANRTLDAFSDRLRQEVDLDSVATDLRGVVATTMQPTQLSLWLRTEAAR